MIYVGKLEDGRAILYYQEKYAIESGEPYTPFEDIPEGEGLLMTDLERLWWEPVPEPQPEPEPEPEPSAENEVWAEMAAAIREGVNAV